MAVQPTDHVYVERGGTPLQTTIADFGAASGTTRAAMQLMALNDMLTPLHLYYLEDEDRIAIATSINTFQAFAKEGESAAPSGSNDTPSIIALNWAMGSGGFMS